MTNTPTGTETIWVVGRQNGTFAAEEETFTLQQIADLGGGGGYVFEQTVTSGTTNVTNTVNTFVGWKSATAGAKTNIIPTSTGSKNVITIADLIGTAGTDFITPVPLVGTIINAVNSIVYTNFGVITLYDSSQGWVSI